MNVLHLTVSSHIAQQFSPLLEKGVGLPVVTGCTIRDLLCNTIGLTDEYLDQRIQTLFLNFRPVDDVDKATIDDGSTLALSSAMPGILGATMRKGGRYAPFREGISHEEGNSDTKGTAGYITIKMFNIVAKEVGLRLFETGADVDGADIFRVVAQLPGKLTEHIEQMSLDGETAEPELPLFKTLSDKRVRLSITLVDDS